MTLMETRMETTVQDRTSKAAAGADKDALIVTIPRLPAVRVAAASRQEVSDASPPPPPTQLIGADLRRMREAVGMTQTELAEALGYSRAMVCRWESGAYRVPRTHLPRLLAVLTEAKRRLDEYHRLMRQIGGWPTIGEL